MADLGVLCESLEKRFGAKTRIKDNVCYVEVGVGRYLEVAEELRKEFDRLLTVSAVDFIKQGLFEVYFVLYDFETNVYCKVSTKVPRDRAEVDSLSSLWPNASMHEREVWEMFGIKFRGNPMLRPLLTEDWRGPPPFRKDFDWRKYVAETYKIPQALR